MADNVPLTPGTGADFATDDIGGVHYPRAKLSLGADGTAVDAGAGEGASGTDTQRVVLANNTAIIGALTETAPASDTASSGLNGRLQRIAQRITSLIALIPASLGSKADAASLAVTQSTEDKAVLAAMSAKLPATLGSKADSASLAVTKSTEDKALTGALTETAPASDTASSGLNGRLQRIAQRLTSVLTAIGATTSTAAGVDQNGDLIAQVRQLTKENTQLPTSLVATMLSVAATIRSDQIYAGAALTPKFAAIAASSSGANTVVAAVTSKKIRVLAWDMMPNGAVNAKWQSATTPTDLTGLYYMAGQGNGVARAFCPAGYFETIAGEGLVLNLSGAVAVGGVLTYIEV